MNIKSVYLCGAILRGVCYRKYFYGNRQVYKV